MCSLNQKSTLTHIFHITYIYMPLLSTYSSWPRITIIFRKQSFLFFKRFTKFVPSVQLFIAAGKKAKKVSSTV